MRGMTPTRWRPVARGRVVFTVGDGAVHKVTLSAGEQTTDPRRVGVEAGSLRGATKLSDCRVVRLQGRVTSKREKVMGHTFGGASSVRGGGTGRPNQRLEERRAQRSRERASSRFIVGVPSLIVKRGILSVDGPSVHAKE